MGLPIAIDQKHRTNGGALRVSPNCDANTMTAAVVDFVPAATPTDSLAWGYVGYDGVPYLVSVTLQATADMAGSINALLQRVSTGSGGTSALITPSYSDKNDVFYSAGLYAYSANKSAGGDGVSATRPLIRAIRLPIGTTTTPATPITIDLRNGGGKGLTVHEFSDWIALNFQGQALPLGFKMNASFTWIEERSSVLILAGDSTTDFRASGGTIWGEIRQNELSQIYLARNHGTNGTTAVDYLNGTGGAYYSLANSLAFLPLAWPRNLKHKMVLCYLINDVRLGACDLATAISRLDALITAAKASKPELEIILYGPNALSSDNYNSNGYVTATGGFAGMTLAQAAQAANDIMYNAYASFASDSRVKKVLQKQDVTGRTAVTVAASGYLSDQLHPNARAQVLHAHYLLNYLITA